MKKGIKDAENAAKETAEKMVKEAPKTAKRVTRKAVKAVSETAAVVGEKAAAKAGEVKKEAKKAVAAKKPAKETVYLQYMGKEVNKDDLMKSVKEVWTKQMKRKVGELKSVTLYLKPEENKAYYVINDEVTGSIEL